MKSIANKSSYSAWSNKRPTQPHTTKGEFLIRCFHMFCFRFKLFKAVSEIENAQVFSMN